MKDFLILVPVFSWVLQISTLKSNEELLSSYEAKVWEAEKNKKLLYRTASPAEPVKGKKYPMLVFFHGAGGRK